MDDIYQRQIAIGRKEIMKALHVEDWGTVRAWYRNYQLPLRYTPSKRPFIIVTEFIEWLIKCDEVNKKP